MKVRSVLTFFAILLSVTLAQAGWIETGCIQKPGSKKTLIKQSSCGQSLCTIPDICIFIDKDYANLRGIKPINEKPHGPIDLSGVTGEVLPPNVSVSLQSVVICTAAHCDSFENCIARDPSFDIKQEDISAISSPFHPAPGAVGEVPATK